MKKQNSFVSNWSVKGIIIVTVLSAMFCTTSAKATNKPTVALNAITLDMKSENGVESLKNSITESNSEVMEAEYNAKEFVEADMELEIESWMNSNTETNNEVAETIQAPQIEYKAEEFVEAEIVNEIQSWINTSSYWNDFETFDNVDVTGMIGSWINSSSYWAKGKNFRSKK
ncbi:MAG: hypothetical protein NTY07_20280 [Bacteroidia bacterium]|nr:hypothetical protein [Bacteroidia bacterium]